MSIFAPLHVISGFSFLQSGLTIENIVATCKKQGYFGIGLTDKGVMFGLPRFINVAELNDIPFIIGMEISIDGDSISLFVESEEGYRNLVYLATLYQSEEFNFEDLKNHSNGLTGVIETIRGTFKEKFLEKPIDESFTTYLLKYSNIFEHFYLGIEVTSREELAYAKCVREFASNYLYNCVAFPRIRYAKKEDAIVLEIVDAIDKELTLTNKKAEGQDYFMAETDYQKIYTESEIKATVDIVKSSNFNFHQKRGEILHFPVDDSVKTLKDSCFASLTSKGLNEEKYVKQLNHELDIIISMGYADYFLIVQDYVKYAKENHILVGAGRGSAPGSLVSYLLDITEVNPMDYDLQFERFLNPSRTSMPDIDIDFMDTRRDEMVQYMRERYGKEKVANIVTFQTILAKQAIRDIGRVYKFPDRHIDLLSKRLTVSKLSLRESYKTLNEFRSLVDSDPYFLEIVSLASKIEGLPRQTGLHAAGIILNNTDLDDSIPVTIDFYGNYISQYEMGYLEEQGFLKMDFLGLRNLTTIDICLKMIEKNKGVHMEFSSIPYNEQENFDLIASCHTMGVFQLESSGMKRAIRILKPNCFNDVVALLALFRPGPMDSIQTYAKRKEGKEKIPSISPEVDRILAPTYGIIVYQEQINQIATVMAGFSKGEADLFRRAVSKKKKDVIDAQGIAFVKGAIANGYSEKEAKMVFNHILPFAGYGFNKSHSVVYSILASRMAYLKCHYPLEFYSAILASSSSANDTKFLDYVSEIKSRCLDVYLPNVNKSLTYFAIEEKGLVFPLNEIKGINISVAKDIIHERESNGLFESFIDFVRRMYAYKVSEKEYIALIDAGALDTLYHSRETMRVTLRSAMQYSELTFSNDGQLSIGIPAILPPRMIDSIDDNLENIKREHNVLDIMISGNPLQFKQDLIKYKNAVSIADSIGHDEEITICGIIRSFKTIRTKKGTTMAFIKLFDRDSEMEVTVFPKVYEESVQFIENNAIILVTGKYEYSNYEEDKVSFIAEKIKPLEE